MKKIKAILSVLTVIAIIGVIEVYALTSNGYYSVTLPKGQTVSLTMKKQDSYDCVVYRLINIKPTSTGEDTYKKMKMSIYNQSTKLMEEKVITESISNTLYRYSHIKDLSAGDTITYKMRGNNPDLPAIADVYLGWY